MKEAQTAFDASSKKLSELQEKKKLTDKKLENAKKKASDSNKAALSAAAAALDSVAKDVCEMSQDQADRARTLAHNRTEMVQQKRKMEKLCRDVVGQLAVLTSRLESNIRAEGVESPDSTGDRDLGTQQHLYLSQ